MADNKDYKQILKDIKDNAEATTKLKMLEDDYYNSLARRKQVGKAILENTYKQYKIEREIKGLYDALDKVENKKKANIKKLISDREKLLKQLGKELDKNNRILKQQRALVGEYRKGITILKSYEGVFKRIASELMGIDKEIKQTVLGLALSESRSAQFRDNLNGAALYTSMIGVGAADLAKIQKTYADETGRALVLSKQELISISQIAKGTMLGAEGAAKLVGSFELIGFSTKQIHGYVEDVMNMSQQSGLNADNIVKKIAENFKRSQMYSFRNGIKGLAEMSKYAEKFKNDIGSTFSAMDKARTLEGAIEMAANLQVIGGQFASSDPFQLLNLARNDPQKFQKMLNEMTRGVSQFNKTTGEFEITALNLDRLRLVAEATGQDFNNLAEQSKQFAKVSTIERNLFGLSKQDKELVSSLATYDKKTMKWEIKGVGDINKLSKTQIELLRGEKQTLEERAKASITFNEQMVFLVDTLKASLLPLLEGVNMTLKLIQKVTTPLSSMMDGWGKYIVQFGFVATGLLTATKMISGVVRMIGPLSAVAGKIATRGGMASVGKALTNYATPKSNFGKMRNMTNITKQGSRIGGSVASGAASAGKAGGFLGGLGSASSLLALGAAITSVGLAINLATKGVAEMATAFQKLDANKIDKLNVTLGVLGVTIIGTLVGGILALSAAGKVGAVGLGILGASVLAIGAGIGLATAGIGYMTSSIAKFGDASFAKNIGTLASNMSMITTLDYDDTKKTFGVISDVLKRESAMKEFGNMVNSLKGLDNINNPLSELKDMFKNPLKVEFANKNVNLSVNVDVNMDGNSIYKESNIAKKVMIDFVDFKSGKNSPKI